MQTQTTTNVQESTKLSVAIQLACVAILGSVLIFGAGFLDTAAAHNAAHDTRHSQGFPCH